jgi:hypothetical protein
VTYFSCGSVHYFSEVNDLAKSCDANKHIFQILTWNCSVDVRDIFFMWISPLLFTRSTIDQNGVTWTTSTVFKTLTSNFMHIFGIKRRCDIFSCGSLHYFFQGSTISQNFLTRITSTVLKILTWNFKRLTWSVHLHDIFFMRISPLLLGGGRI